MDDPLLQRVVDELEIRRLLARLAQSADDRDVEAYRGCFADQVLCPEDRSGVGPLHWISSEAYARSAIDSILALDWIHHRLSNFIITVDGDAAHARVDLVAEMQSSNEQGVLEWFTLGGRYEIELARLPVGWRIARRTRLVRYTIGDPSVVQQAKLRRARQQAQAPCRHGD